MLRQNIFSGKLADGEELGQEELAEKLRLSRMPVREAFQLLETEGFFRRLPNRHMQVVGPREKTIRETFSLLAAVETEIALLALRNGVDLSPLENAGESQFHHTLSRISGNYYIERIHAGLLNGYPRYVWESLPGRDDAAALQRNMLDALKSADEAAAVRAIGKYYRSLAEALISPVKETSVGQSGAN